MPFTSRSRPVAPVVSPASAAVSSGPAEPTSGDGPAFDAAALHQDPATVQRKDRQDPVQLVSEEKAQRQKALRTLNTLRVIAPAMHQALATGQDEKAQSQRFTEIMTAARGFAQDSALALGLDPDQDRNRWAVGMLERAYLDIGGDLPVTVAPALREAALAAAADRGQETRVPEHLGDTSLVQLALIRSLPGLVQAQAQFNFYRPDPEGDLKVMAQLLLDTATQVLLGLVDPVTPDHERQTLLVALVEEGGKLLANSWTHLARLASRASQKQTADQMAVWRRATPEGISLDPVQDRFRQHMATLSQLLKPRRRR